MAPSMSCGIAANAIHKDRAIATVETFFQAANCPQTTKNALLYLKKGQQETAPASSTHGEILKKLSAIEKILSTPPADFHKLTSYADFVHLALPHKFQEKPVLSRALNEVLVTVVEDPKSAQTSGRLLESITTTHASQPGKVIAVQKLDSGVIVITTDSNNTKTLLEQEEE